MSKNLNNYFTEKDIRMANKHMKGCPTSLVVGEMQIIVIVRLSLHIYYNEYNKKKTDNNKFWQGYSEVGTLIYLPMNM